MRARSRTSVLALLQQENTSESFDANTISQQNRPQMSRFIPAGESDLIELKAKEKSASTKYQQEEDDAEAPSLYEQMRLNHMEKERQYQEKVKARNQPHKIDDREHKFYEDLRKKEVSKEEDKKRELEEGLEAFERIKKQKVSKEMNVSDMSIKENFPLPKVNVIKKKGTRRHTAVAALPQKRTESPPKNQYGESGLISGYSSLDSDSE